jgi:hypothetical protein
MRSFLDWHGSCSVLCALGLLASGCASGTAGQETQNEGAAHGVDDGGASDDDGALDDDQVATDDGDEGTPGDGDGDGDGDSSDDDGAPNLDAGGDDGSGDDSVDDDWANTDSSDDGPSDGTDGTDSDAAIPDPDGCMTLAANAPSANFNTLDAVCFSVAAQPSTAWEVYRVGSRTVTIDGVSVSVGQLPWPGSAPYVVEFSAGNDATTAWAYW